MKSREKILVVDDEAIVAASIKGILEKEGYAVSTVSSGQEALQRLQSETFDLVLTDLVMEGMNGLDVIKEIKQTAPETIVMIITGYASLNSAIEAMRRGAYDYLTKPCSSQQLKMAIQRGLEKKRLGTELKKKSAELELSNKELAERMEQIAAVHRISDNMQRFSTIDELLSQIAQGVKESLGFERALISLVNKNEAVLERRASAGMPEEEFQKVKSQNPPLNEVVKLFKEKYRISRSYYIRYTEHEETIEKYGSAFEDLRVEVAPGQWHPGDALLTPLLSEREELIGIISVDNPKDGKVPSQTTIKTLETFANTAGAAIERARLEEKLAAIYDLSREAALAFDFDQISTTVLDTATRVLHFDNIAFILIDEKANETYIAAHIGYPKEIESRRLPVDGNEGITVQAIKSGQPILVPDVRKDPHYIEGRPGTLSELAVPMKIRDKVIGVLNVESSTLDAFDKKDVALLSALAAQTATAIENTRLKEQINAAKNYLENLVNSSVDAIISTDERGVLTFFSKGAEEIFGYKAEEVVGRPVGEYYYGEMEEARKVMDILREKGRVLSYETEFKAKNGRVVPVSLSASLLRDEKGEIVGTLGISKDITERKKLEEEKERLRAQLTQSEKLSALGELISGVAHELNNPLTGVLGYSQLLLGSDSDPRTKRDVEKIYREATRCQKIVNSLLSFARRQKPERAYVNINAVIESALNLRVYQLKVDGVEVVKRLDENLSKTMADPHQLEQVFLNIITNAHQVMLKVKEARRLTITTESSDEIIRIKFTDTGPGIPPENLKRIFDPFFTTKDVGQGTGLGLSLSYGFIKEHEGSIYATSKLGQGATFVVELPVKEEAAIERKATAAQEVEPSGGGKILVVDDEQVVLDLLFDILHELGHQVDTAVNGHIALKLITQNDYDLILTDLKMPGMDGRQLYDRVLLTDPDLAKRMIFITGYAISADMQTFFDTTKSRHIEKPFNIDTLREIIQENLGREI